MITVADLISGFEASEAWRPVVGYEGVYEVSSFGRVRRVAPAFGANPGQVLAPIVNFGYLHVDLSCENVVQRYRIHRLVADAFIGLAPFSDALVAH